MKTEHWISQFIGFSDKDNSQRFIKDIREKSLKEFEKIGFPNRKNEDWKYLNLAPVLSPDYIVFDYPTQAIDYNQLQQQIPQQFDSYKLVFVDGKFISALSETTHQEADICILSSALEKSIYRSVIENYYNTSPKDNGFAFLNSAFATEGAYIFIPDAVQLSKPVQVIYFYTSSGIDVAFHPRNLVVIGSRSQLVLVENHISLSKNKVLINAVTEVFVHPHGQLEWYKIQNDPMKSSIVDNSFIHQEKSSEVKVLTFSSGHEFIRNNLNVYLKGEYTFTRINGITLGKGNQVIDHHTFIDHLYPNCESHELYRAILDEQARGVFNGKIMVHPEAQKTNAFQQNNTLLLSDESSIDTKPQLEIFADDVKCSHGCTVGQLDEKSLFYLRARGIPEKQAKALLLKAFCNDVLADFTLTPLVEQLLNQVESKLS